MSDLDFGDVFRGATGMPSPYAYQCRLACGDNADPQQPKTLRSGSNCESKLINVPTGLGKTAAVVLAWLWNRVLTPDETHRNKWPRRLVYCLPMRTLVEQTECEATNWLAKLRENADRLGFVENAKQELEWLVTQSPIILMGGEDLDDARRNWDLYPEKPAILIGTQDMLLSRALNRGYGISCYRWPTHFGLLNNDCLWVMDETQLMGPGLWTSAQLDWMRQDRFPALLLCATWWMSATISPDFLDTFDRRNASFALPEPFTLKHEPRAAALLDARRPCRFWNQVAATRPGVKGRGKTAQQEDPERVFAAALAEAIVQEHATGTLSLVVCNTVRLAQLLFEAVARKRADCADAIMLTSRFRPMDRQENAAKLIEFERARKNCRSHRGLVCISTQVVEAGIDVSARRLWSEIAPWSSVLQRLGRLNRADDLVPGMLIMLPVSAGGYDRRLGWTGRKTDTASLEDAPPAGLPEEWAIDDQAFGCWVDLQTHLDDVEKAAESVIEVFPQESPYRDAILRSARYHDIGKSIPQWQQALPQPTPQSAKFWAKAPFLLRIEAEARTKPSPEAIEQVLRTAQIPFRRTTAEQPGRKRDPHLFELHFHLGRKPSKETAEELSTVSGLSKAVIARFRPGLRHEAASTLALWWRFYYDGHADFPALTLYGVAAHHGIVRTSLSAREQEEPNICGIPLTVSQIPWDGGMPLDFDCSRDGAAGDFSEDGRTFIFRAPGWTGLVTDLLGGWQKDAPRAPSGAV